MLLRDTGIGDDKNDSDHGGQGLFNSSMALLWPSLTVRWCDLHGPGKEESILCP